MHTTNQQWITYLILDLLYLNFLLLSDTFLEFFLHIYVFIEIHTTC